jgi:Domain of unknown function (DUF1905)/Bacteriocin-protection, YdeI or OmpD-Associated
MNIFLFLGVLDGHRGTESPGARRRPGRGGTLETHRRLGGSSIASATCQPAKFDLPGCVGVSDAGGRWADVIGAAAIGIAAGRSDVMRFRATIEAAGKTATGIPVPAEIVEALGSGKRPAVRVTIRDYSYRSTVAPMGGRFMLPVSAEVRQNAGVAAGDTVEVDLETDNAPREVSLPPDFAAALDQDADAKRFFDGLSYSRKQWHVLSIEGAKTSETRERRIQKSLGLLREGRAQ